MVWNGKAIPVPFLAALSEAEFPLLDTDMEGTEAEQRIFGEVLSDPAGYSEKTGLQKAAKKFLMEGKKLGNGLGIYLPGR